ncbi:phosphomannomutase [Fontimonas thermophila]|uniref:phosphomannomutase n=1 Tax=Fontimonas thermophila TaxID=1076937 RepID=A0A1I2JK30_9GAMM|nr:phosphomannomutase [Fontimonas thermophila]
MSLPCFKAYDIRGRVPDELNTDLAYRLGIAYAEHFHPRTVALGRDVRPSGEGLLQALAHGLIARGVRVLDLGLCGTEEVYWAAQQPGIDGAIAITASHNPSDYNGMKLVRASAVPVSGDSGLRDLERRVAALDARAPTTTPRMEAVSFRDAYVRHLLGYLDRTRLKPLRIVVNAGNGAAGPLIDALEPALPFELIKLHHEPDGRFPHGIPNPLLPENRSVTAEAVRAHRADLGVAWDGDFDRCFLFDETGSFIEGYYIVGLLACALLAREEGGKIIHDPRLTWNTIELVRAAGGTPIQSKTGHAFIKERMRAENAIYGGEMSAHHYFRDFGYCDNGSIPWLLVAELISTSERALSALVGERQRRYPVSGEINRRVHDIGDVIAAIERRYAPAAASIDHTDGVSIEFADWRFNLRGSNTEPVLRLNVEARDDTELMRRRTEELLAAIDAISRT